MALGSHSNSRPVKSVVSKTDISDLALAAAFDMRWLKMLSGRSPSSVALDADATPRPCPGAVRDTSCMCQGLDTPAHLFSNDHSSCLLAMHEPIFRQMLASLWFRYGVLLLGDVHTGTIPLEVRLAVRYRSGFIVAVKPARNAVPLLMVQEAAAHERFQIRRDKIEEHQTTTARRADRRLQKLLIWEKDSPGNLLHIDHYRTAAERLWCHLAHDEDGMVALDEDELRSEESEVTSEELNADEAPVSQPDPYCAVPLDCPGYSCNLRVSVVACLFAAWTATRKAAQRWVLARDEGLWCHCKAETDLHAWLQLPDAAAFAADGF